MTFSLHQSTAITDKQAASNKSQTLNIKGDATADMMSDAEQGTSESSFSKLFSIFSSDNSDSTIDANTETSPASNGNKSSVSLASIGEAPEEMTAAEDITAVTQDDNQPKAESNDDFLARLGQSSMLLQSNTGSDVKAAAQNQADGNELPLAAEEVNIASTPLTLTGMPDTSVTADALGEPVAAIDEDLAEPVVVSNDELTQVLQTTEQSAEIPTGASIIPNNPMAALAQTEVAGVTEKNMDTLKDNGLDSADKFNVATGTNGSTGAAGLTDSSMVKSTPFGQANTVAAGIAGTATTDSNATADISAMTPSESTEQLDFAQIMESARKQEPLEQASRTLAKAPVLTDAEQQVLEKRVNLNNNLASSELNEKIAIMAGKELQTATIRLDPAELGSMNIKLVVQNDQINVTIQAQNNQSRDLLEQQMPRLREMLQQQGMTLGESQVQADSGQQQSGFQQSRQENGQKNSNNEANYTIDSQSEAPVTTQYWQDSTKGVDFYA